MPTFEELGLSDALLRAIATQGYDTPSPIQQKAIPHVLAGRDVMAAAQTGTGKTAAFTLPMLQRLRETAPGKGIRALVITPTRELAAQVEDSVTRYGEHGKLRSQVVFGGVKINPQIAALKRGVDILVATPGRLLDLHGQGVVDLSQLEILVLDEADRMLDMGFIHDIRRVIKLLPQQRQTLMFSATFSGDIRELARQFMRDPVEVSVTPANSTADTVQQWVYPVDKGRKPELLAHLIKDRQWHQVLVFTRTKHGANRLTQKLEKTGITAAAIHGNKSQGARTRALEGFKQGKVQALVATDIAARGLDIAQLPQVVNFDLPNVAEDYVHRIGRTGRAGAAGRAYSLVSADEAAYLQGIERLIGQAVTREDIAGFEPEQALPRHRAGQGQGAPRGNSRSGNTRGANGRKDGAPPANRRRRGRRRPAAQGNRGTSQG
ncbi:MAG: DEAD/DEAH box helicase [Halieaceae bacterium]|jgi:ATP-dependent RNA helicase RhlE|nr:DEAD/DEAH box helicase [Halieaceae bacterium]